VVEQTSHLIPFKKQKACFYNQAHSLIRFKLSLIKWRSDFRKHGSPEGSATTHLKCAGKKLKISFKDKGHMKTFPDKQEGVEFFCLFVLAVDV
jgi:hypothetical protein